MDDLPLAAAIWGDPRVTAKVGGPFDAAHVVRRLAHEIATHDARGYQYWPIFAGPAHVGCCGLKPAADPRAVELGYYLRPEWWGQGLAAEAAASVVTFAFARLDLDAIVAGHHPENTASGRVLERLGFAFTHREVYPPTGLEHPNYRLDR